MSYTYFLYGLAALFVGFAGLIYMMYEPRLLPKRAGTNVPSIMGRKQRILDKEIGQFTEIINWTKQGPDTFFFELKQEDGQVLRHKYEYWQLIPLNKMACITGIGTWIIVRDRKKAIELSQSTTPVSMDDIGESTNIQALNDELKQAKGQLKYIRDHVEDEVEKRVRDAGELVYGKIKRKEEENK